MRKPHNARYKAWRDVGKRLEEDLTVKYMAAVIAQEEGLEYEAVQGVLREDLASGAVIIRDGRMVVP
jgi:hypothetical protein